MNINNFDYIKDPLFQTRKYKIQTLTGEGFHQYIDKESYPHKYLKNLTPMRMKEFFNEIPIERGNSKKFTTGLNRNKSQKRVEFENELNNEQNLGNDNFNEEQGENIQNLISQENVRDQGNHKISKTAKNLNKTKFKIQKEVQQNAQNNQNNQNNFNTIDNFNTTNSKTHRQTNSEFFNTNYSSKNYFNNSPIKNIKKSSPLNINDENISQKKYEENHMQNFFTLKRSLSNFKSLNNISSPIKNSFPIYKRSNPALFSQNNFFPNNNTGLTRSLSKPGFKSYNVPRIEKYLEKSNLKQDNNILQSQLLNKKIKLTLKNSTTCNQESEKNIITKNENEKLKEYLQTVEYYQNSNLFPNIKNICSQNKINSRGINLLSDSRSMGEKYNPLNFYHGDSKSQVKRNLHGAIFQH